MRRSSVSGAALAALMLAVMPGAPAAQEKPVERQITDAVSPLPEHLQADATVLGYRDGALTELRAGTNGMICMADDPAKAHFHTACYHESLEPYMARGRALRAQGMSPEAADSVRYAEFESGALPTPPVGATLYALEVEDDAFDPSGGVPDGTFGWYVVYIPFATEASSGLPLRPAGNRPWLMYAGKPTAHVMIMR